MTLRKLGIFTIVAIASMVVTNSCNDADSVSTAVAPHQNQNGGVTRYKLDGTEGGPIIMATAEEWINHYAEVNQVAASAQYFGQKTISGILSKDGCMGIRFYYALDESGNQHLLAMGSNAAGSDFTLASQAKGLNASAKLHLSAGAQNTFTGNESEFVPEQTATQWITSYNSVNPTSVRAHFFGSQLVNQILKQKGCVGIRVYFGLDRTGVRKLILVGVTVDGTNILPSSSDRIEDGDGTLGDNSFPCPSFC